MTNQTVKNPVTERRTPVDANEPLLRSDWQFDHGRIVGRVIWGSCVSERSWSVEDQRIEHVRPLPTAALIIGGAGLTALIAGVATRKNEGPTSCGLVNGISTCVQEAPNNTTSNLVAIMGGVALATASLMLAIKPSDNVTVLQREPHAEKSVSPCLAPAELNLLLKLGPNRFTHITVDANGQASADLPAHAHLPKGTDLEIVVYRAPPVFSKTLPQWTVIGHVHVPE